MSRGTHGFDSPRARWAAARRRHQAEANIFVQLSPNYNWMTDGAQYVTTVKDPTATAFSGTRYVFGYITTSTMSLDTRVNWTITPTLTMQLYAQPFIASGAYERSASSPHR